MTQKTRNSDLLWDFVAYCQANPTQRFWQALRNWSGQSFILSAPRNPRVDYHADPRDCKDTFY